VLVAATNHQALLDPAIRRRFHVVLDLPLPGESERQQILARAAGQFGESLPEGLLVGAEQRLTAGRSLTSKRQCA
jgi:AAA+ superfamily predicted ATPase